MRRPGYPLDRAGAYVFLERALELPHSGEGLRSRKQRLDHPIAHERDPVRTRDLTSDPCRRDDRESGQAMVEFALILFPLLLIVAGIIQFGIALNYWLDMQRIANQGARWAAVNCTRSATTPPCVQPVQPELCRRPCAHQALAERAEAIGLCRDLVPVRIGTQGRSGEGLAHDAVHRRPASSESGQLDLGAEATMRMEWTPTAFSARPRVHDPRRRRRASAVRSSSCSR